MQNSKTSNAPLCGCTNPSAHAGSAHTQPPPQSPCLLIFLLTPYTEHSCKPYTAPELTHQLAQSHNTKWHSRVQKTPRQLTLPLLRRRAQVSRILSFFFQAVLLKSVNGFFWALYWNFSNKNDPTQLAFGDCNNLWYQSALWNHLPLKYKDIKFLSLLQ